MKTTIHSLTFTLLLRLLYACATSPDNTKTLHFVSCEGAQLLDTNKAALTLKGTNLGNWLVPEGYMFKTGQVNSPRKIDELLKEMIGPEKTDSFWLAHLEVYIQKKDIEYLKKIGCNHVRLPFHYKLFTNEPYLGTVDAGFAYTDKLIEWCKEAGLYVLLDMHCAPGGQTGDNIDDSYGYPYLFTDEAAKKQFVAIWHRIAEHYKNENTVVGYDLVNEPIAHYFKDDQAFLEKGLIEVYQRAIDTIRSTDTSHLIFVNGSMWSTNFEVFETPFKDNKIVYEFHKYWMPPVQKEIQDYVDFRDEHQVPIYVGETGENTDEWVMQFRTLLDSNAINWCFWPYKKMNNPKGIMNFEQPKAYESIVNYAAADRSSYKAIRSNRPDADSVQTALKGYLHNANLDNCYPNTGYCKGLGLF